MNASTRQTVYRVLSALAEGRIEPWMKPAAAKVAPAFEPPRREPRRAGAQPTRAEAKAAKATAETKAMAYLRERVFARAGGVGELCGRPLAPELGELCHLDGGSGKRRQQQRPENCVAEHHECHQGPLGFDRKPLAWLPAVRTWADRIDVPVPERFRKLEALAEVKHV